MERNGGNNMSEEIKVSEMQQADNINDEDVCIIIQKNTNKKATVRQILESKQDKVIEGTWTPTLTTLEDVAPTMTYIIRQGTYKKLGKLVYLSFYIRGNITALNGSENYVKITGIPFRSFKTMLESVLNVGGLYQMLENEENVNAFINDNVIRVQTQYGEVAGKLKVTPAGGTGYFEISASGWYETNEQEA